MICKPHAYRKTIGGKGCKFSEARCLFPIHFPRKSFIQPYFEHRHHLGQRLVVETPWFFQAAEWVLDLPRCRYWASTSHQVGLGNNAVALLVWFGLIDDKYILSPIMAHNGSGKWIDIFDFFTSMFIGGRVYQSQNCWVQNKWKTLMLSPYLEMGFLKKGANVSTAW